MVRLRLLRGLDLLTIGDATLDVFLRIHEATLSCQINKQQCLLCFNYADKIPVESVIKIPGAGNASNAAVGGARLGMRSAIVCFVGNDEVGREMLAGWKQARVATSYVRIDRRHDSNYSTVLDYHGERTILVYHQPHEYVLPSIDGADWIYYTSIGPGHERLEKQLLAHLAHYPKQPLAFNPGTHQLRRGLKALTPVIKRSSLFAVNREEADRLLEDGHRPVENMLMSFAKMGAKVVVITDGEHGSYATDGKKMWNMGIFPGKVVERTGAGDGYTTGMLYALWKGMTVPEAMRVGTANAWSVIQRVGPQAGLLNEQVLATTLKKFARVQAREQRI